MPVTPLSAFRLTPPVLAAIDTIRALLSDRTGRDVSKTDAIAFAVLRVAGELQGDAVQPKPAVTPGDPIDPAAPTRRPVGAIGGKLAAIAESNAQWEIHEQQRQESDRMAREAHIRNMTEPKPLMSLPAYKGDRP